LLTCENESCEHTDHSSTFYHNRPRSYASAISSNTITCHFPVGKRDISSLFAISLTQPTFSHYLSEAYVANLISTKIDIFFALYFTIAKSTNASNNWHKAICLAIHGGFYGHDNCLVYKQQVLSIILPMREMTYHPSDDYDFSIRTLLILSIQTQNHERNRKGSYSTLSMAGAQCMLEPSRPFSVKSHTLLLS